MVGQDFYSAALCYSALSASTLVCGYATVKSIPLATLNSTRLLLLCHSFLECTAKHGRRLEVRCAACKHH